MLILTGCDPDGEDKDNKILMDATGRYYLLEHHIGTNYHVSRLDSSAINTLKRSFN